MAVNRRIGYVVLCVVWFGIGALVSRVLADIPYFRIERNIDVVALTALLLTLVISVSLYRYHERVKHSDQLRKQVVLERLESCRERLKQVESICHDNQTPLRSMVKATSACRREFDGFPDYAQAIECVIEAKDTQAFAEALRDIWRLTTSTARREDPVKKLWLDGDKLRFHRDREVEIERAIDKAVQLLHEMKRQVILSGL